MFADRSDAGRQLADLLARSAPDDPVVIGMARGGVVVAAPVAERLGAPLDVIVVRKVGFPWQPELAVGAIAEGGVLILDDGLIADLGLGRADLAEVIRRERRLLHERIIRYRAGRAPIPVRSRTAVLVDDGLATGSTARAAIASLRRQAPAAIVVAVPVAPPETVASLRGIADDVVVVETHADLFAIGQFYADFSPTTDDEVTELLAAARADS